MRTKWMVLPLALLATACSEELSGQIETQDIRVGYYAEASTSSSGQEVCKVRAHFTEASSWSLTDVRLEGEQVFALADSREAVHMPRNSVGFYDVELAGPVREVRFELRRKEDKVSALDSRVPVPPPLDLGPVPERLAENEELELTWSNPITDHPSSVTVSPEPCGGTSSIVLGPSADTGSLRLAASKLLVGSAAAEGECVTLRFTRTVQGTLDPAFSERSLIEGKRFEHTQLTVTP